MNKSSIQAVPAGVTPAALQSIPTPNGITTGLISTPPVTGTRRKQLGIIRGFLQALASLRLTVVLFALSMVLIFVGTLAQMDAGIGTVVKDYFRSLYVWVPLQLFVRFGQVFFSVPPLTRLSGAFPFPGGWLIGGLLLLNLLAAHAVRFRLTWKRSGVLILHTGIIVLMAGELLTGLFAVEGQMTIHASGVSNIVKHNDTPELAVTGPLETVPDEVTVVSGARLRQGGVIQHDQLPFDVQIDEYMPNSRLVDLPASATSRATTGDGLRFLTEPATEGAGVDPDQRIDFPSAYITLKKKGTGEALGTYLVSSWLSELADKPDQKVTVDGKTYAIALRFKRTYTPYTFQLLAFHHDNYPGTDIPNNFSSQIRILDPDQKVDREVNIRMNAPLRYQRTTDEPWWQLFVRGQETFYQQGFLPGDTGTILQVVRNPGWLAPYFACGVVALGMLIHFGITLYGFLRKQRLAVAVDSANTYARFLGPGSVLCGVIAFIVFMLYMSGYYLPAAAGFLMVYGILLLLLHYSSGSFAVKDDSDGFARYFPWLVVGAGVALVLFAMLPLRDVSDKPHLQELAALPVQANGRVKPLDTVARVTLSDISNWQTFAHDNKKMRPAIEWLVDVMTSRLPGNQRKEIPEDYAVFYIENDQVLSLLGLKPREGWLYAPHEFAANFTKLIEEASKADAVPDKERTVYQKKVLELANKVRTYIEVARLAIPRLVPPETPSPNADWLTLPQAAGEIQAGREDPITFALFAVLQAYAKDQTKEFNENLAKYRSLITAKLPTETAKADFEIFFNSFDPFFVCMPLYVGVFVLAAVSWLGWSRPLNRAAFWLTVLALTVHTFGLAARMYLQGRPPVTNLYSSAVFIGWTCVLLGLALEVIFHLGIGNALAGALGFSGVLIAHKLSSGDTLEMMRAVLDTNFWLATHVVCVTIGYSATFLAGFLGLLYIFYTWNGKSDRTDRETTKALVTMIYGVLCFATLFSFVGTVLGGIWADQSWGRFWGWDPKENGALLIVIMNALTLHARWAGMVKQRGVAVLAVVGNIVTGWSWFGTNQLSVGLHAYGFNDKLALSLTLFWISQVGVIMFAVLPGVWTRLRRRAA